MNMNTVVSNQLRPKPTGSVIFLHGSGDTGDGLRVWIKELLGTELQFPHLRILYPTAPLIPYTPMGGALSNVWFDRVSICPTVPECLESINSSGEMIKHLVQQEVDSGIPIERIIIGGFSMGGAMTMHLAYRMIPDVTGCFAISSFLNEISAVYETLKAINGKLQPPLVMMHGDNDSLVPSEWGMDTFRALQKLGVEGSFNIFKTVSHEMAKEEILQLIKWISMKIPSP